MLTKAQRQAHGSRRKVVTTQTPKGRLALVAVAAGAASTAGMGGAAAATIAQDTTAPAPEAAAVEYEMTNNSVSLATAAEELAPQVLALAEYKPVPNLDAQLQKAVTAVEETRAAEQAAAEAAAQAEAAAAEQAAAAQAFTAASSTQVVSGASVVKPAEGTFTSGFGPRWGSMHNGIDIANAVGTPILAVMDGTVINSGPASGYGNWIRIQHDDGSISVYGHMVSLNVGVGERVSAGQNIAGMGSEGFSTGSHLHFEIHPGGAGPVDPQSWLANHGIYL